MRILRNIIITLLLLALLGISIVGIMVELPAVYRFQPTRINGLGRSFISVMRPGLGLFWMWAAIALSCLLVFFMTVVRPRKRMKIEVQMGGGRVVIMDSAIKRYIRSALAELQGVTVRRIDLRDTRLGVSTDLYADVRTHGNLPVLERQMIQRVRAALAEDLGITSIGEVHVYIRDFEVAERPASLTGVQHAPAQEGRLKGAEPEPVRPAQFTRPTASTGPFDQVPMPQHESAARVGPAATAPLPKELKSQHEQPSTENQTYFTPAPTSPTAPSVVQPGTDLGPKEVFALGELDKSASQADLGSAGSGTAVAPGTASIEDVPQGESSDKSRKRGLFGLWGGAAKGAEPSESGELENASYEPGTATETVLAPTPEGTESEPVPENTTTENPEKTTAAPTE